MIRIFLTGFMGAGKTTLGRAFAKKTGLSFIDLDWYIEERFHKTIGELFAERGEEGFRRLEQKMLHEVGMFEDVIISTGGGTPCYADNMSFMNENGCTVLLKASEDVLFRRLSVARMQRPKLKNLSDDELRQFIVDAQEVRREYYEKAQFCFQADELEDRRQIAESVERLKILLNL